MEFIWRGQSLVLDRAWLNELPSDVRQILHQGTNSDCLEALSQLALDARWTLRIFQRFKPLQIELCSRWLRNGDESGLADLRAFIAIARVLSTEPCLVPYAIELACHRRRGLFRQVGPEKGVNVYLEIDDALLGQCLLSLYRCLLVDTTAFSPIFHGPQIEALLGHSQTYIRYLAVKIRSLYLHAADSATHLLLEAHGASKAALGPWDDRQIDYRYLELWERRRHGIYADLKQSSFGVSSDTFKHSRELRNNDLCNQTIEMSGILQPIFRTDNSYSPSIVSSYTTDKNVASIALALLSPKPILLTGLPGSGKSTLIREVAGVYRKQDTMLTLHLNGQTDAKMLIGMYTSANTPGSFKWQPGILTTAVKEGRWALIEDLDQAPAEVISTILPLLEQRQLYVPNLGGFVKAHPDFRLFATIRSTLRRGSEEHTPGSNMLGLRHWQSVHVKPLTIDDIRCVLQAKHPVIRAYIKQILEVYENLTASQQQISGTNSGQDSTLRVAGPHDLFKAASRIARLFEDFQVKTGSEPVSSHLQEAIFLELFDCFAGFSPSAEMKSHIAETIARLLQIAPQRRDYCLNSRVPAWDVSADLLKVGRIRLSRRTATKAQRLKSAKTRPVAFTNSILRQMESIASTARAREPCLLVGETGTGKTTAIQQLAESMNQRLVVVNLSQQSEAGDLLGGFKPMNLRSLAMPLKDEFEDIFMTSVSSAKSNSKFIQRVAKYLTEGNWSQILAMWLKAIETIGPEYGLGADADTGMPAKRRKLNPQKYDDLRSRWESFAQKVNVFERHVKSGDKGFAFHFVEGNIVKAVREGMWVLLDEINLASADTLESLADLFTTDPLESPYLILAETGEVERVRAHPDFRIFAAMNPATDVGKRELPPSLRSRFTEFYVASPDRDRNSLMQIVEVCLGGYVKSDPTICANISDLYMAIVHLEDEKQLVDGAKQKPHYSMRTLTRALTYAVDIAPMYGIRRSVYEGFCMGFLTLLNQTSADTVKALIEKHILSRLPNRQSIMKQTPKKPDDGKEYVPYAHYWMQRGDELPVKNKRYIITPFVHANLLNLVRAASSRRFPVLLQGPTSSGKTSMVEHLARMSGNRFVRINNHEHTDLQEYLGTYVTDQSGKIHYQEGLLVQALRRGDWIVLDELNLAPTDILEALNRLLDDNRELFIPETQEVVRPHPNFMLFATQNPAGMYGGRKPLSRAFRNRFLELHFDDIPEDELQEILEKRTQIAPSYCRDIIKVYKELAVRRQNDRYTEHKNSFATLRDLFRWALRDGDDRHQLAVHGYMLLAERVRADKGKELVKQAIEDVMKTKIQTDQMYSPARIPSFSGDTKAATQAGGIVWTHSMRRIFVLVQEALKRSEPVLLIGGTGCGKTTVCQIIASLAGRQLHIVNAHQNTETGDLIGAQRPIRNRAAVESQLFSDLRTVYQVTGDNAEAHSSLDALIERYQAAPNDLKESLPHDLKARIDHGIGRRKALFEWSDGSLVQAMKDGQYFLLDEISLADDSVLERLNSVLESGRSIVLAEKGTQDSSVTADPGFQFLATMNPGGDFGKRELSPALRNRFTEIWVPPMVSVDEIADIVRFNIDKDMVEYATPMVKFSSWFGTTFKQAGAALSIREALAWTQFINTMPQLDRYVRLVEGAALVYIDGLGANPAAGAQLSSQNLLHARQSCLQELTDIFGVDMTIYYNRNRDISLTSDQLIVGDYMFPRHGQAKESKDFSMQASTTRNNMGRVLRALQLSKPILLEGSPGVGKTTLVAAVAEAVGVPLTRINLSEQTDLMDLFGSDVPVEGEAAGVFAWSDAPFLQAMQKGEWVLLDEMNLASQSVLEGLNACLDHRGEVYVPELGQTFHRHADFVLFAAQNPHSQGGGRKGLPASFVNRFTIVYADIFNGDDLLSICQDRFPQVQRQVVENMIMYVTSLSDLAQTSPQLSAGGPWEFNLRDILRWLQLMTARSTCTSQLPYQYHEQMLFSRRFRGRDSESVLCNNIQFDRTIQQDLASIDRNLTKSLYQVGSGFVERDEIVARVPSSSSPQDLKALEIAMTAVRFSWPLLIVGPSGSGKSALVRHLASVAGADLIELPLSDDMDTMDLVGGYEQADHLRLQQDLLNMIKNAAERELAVSGANPQLTALWSILELRAFTNDSFLQMHQCISQIAELTGRSIWTDLLDQLSSLQRRESQDQRARFEWTDGVLVRALESGKWLVLDHANLCSASVLDRLNSLLEPNGTLIINEHRTSDGAAKTVRPHKDFRLFLLMDPRHGELSRAMRNRCVELFMPGSDTSETSKLAFDTRDSSLFRLQQLVHPSWNDVSNEMFEPLLSASFERLSCSDVSLTDSLPSQLMAGLQAETTRASVAADTFLGGHVLLTSKPSSFREETLSIYQNLLQFSASDISDLVFSESLLPVNNKLLLSLSRTKNLNHSMLVLSDLYIMRNYIGQVSYLLSKRKQALASMASKPQSRLDRSLLASQNMTFSKEQTAALAPFVADFVSDFAKWLDEQSSHTQTGASMDLLKALAFYPQDLVDLSNSDDFDEASFQAMLGIGSQLASHEAPEDLHLSAPRKILAFHLAKFHQKWRKSSGYGMTAIWSLLRDQTVLGTDRRRALSQVQNLAQQADMTLWNTVTTGTRLQLKLKLKSMIDASRQIIFEAAVSPGKVEERLTLLNESLQELQKDEVASIRPRFESMFQGLLQLRDLQQEDIELLPKTGERIEFLSCRSSTHLSNPLSNEATIELKRMHSSTGLGLDKEPFLALKQHLMPELAVHLHDMTDAPIESLPLAVEELNLLCDSLVKVGGSLRRSPLRTLNMRLLRIQQTMFSSLEHLAPPSTFAKCHDMLSLIIHLDDDSYVDEPVQIPSVNGHAPRSTHVTEVWDKYFLSSLTELKMAFESTETAFDHSANAWTLFFTGVLLLYVPDRPFDPALEPFIRDQIRQKRKNEIETKIHALELNERMNGQSGTTPRITRLRSELEQFSGKPLQANVHRPKPSRFGELQAEFSAILTSIVAKCQVNESSTNTLQTKQVILANIRSAVSRLLRLGEYEDLYEPVVHLLRGLAIGLSLGQIQQDGGESSPAKIVRNFTTILTFDRWQLEAQSASRLRSASCNGVDYRLQYLEAVATDRIITKASSSKMYRTVHELLDGYYMKWKKQLVQDQREYATKSSLYRYRGAPEDDESFNQDLKRLFPVYESEETDSGPDSLMTDSNTADYVQSQTRRLAKLHRALFGSVIPEDTESPLQTLFQKATVASIATIRNLESDLYFDISASQMLPAIALKLQQSRNSLQQPESTQKNFYKGANVSQVQKIMNLAFRMQSRFGEIHESWPNEASPRDVLNTIAELLQLKHTEPIARILKTAEHLHSFVHSWQQVASREYSASELYNELTELLISWRRLELSSWGDLLDEEDRSCAEDAQSWWFIAYETIIAASITATNSGNNLKLHVEELIQTLSDFMKTTCVGQYVQRLDMIEAFERHIAFLANDIGSLSILQKALVNFLAYFRRFNPAVQQFISKHRTDLEKKIKEVVVLTSWKDTNIEALRASARHSHARLFRVVRKYRSLLAEPAGSLLSQSAGDEPTELPSNSQVDGLSAPSLRKELMDRYRAGFSHWDQRPDRFQNPRKTLTLMRGAGSLPGALTGAGSHLKAWTHDITEQSKQLRKETPDTLTEENKELVQSLKTRKRRLFADVLKDIRIMGLKTNIDADTQSRQETIARILSNDANPCDSEGRPIAQRTTFKLFDNIAKARTLLQDRSEDLANNEVGRCIVYLQGFGDTLLQQRQCLAASQQALGRFVDVLQDLDMLCESDKLVQQTGISTKGEVRIQARWIPEVLKLVRWLLETQQKTGGTDVSDVLNQIDHHIRDFQEVVHVLETAPVLPKSLPVSTIQQEQALARLLEAIAELDYDVRSWQKKNSLYHDTFEHLSPWLTQTAYMGSQSTERMDAHAFDQNNLDGIDNMLRNLQEVQLTAKALTLKAGDMKWLTECDRVIQKIHTDFRIDQTTETLKMQIMRLTSYSSDQLPLFSAMYAYSRMFYQQYRNMYNSALETMKTLHVSVAETSTVLSEMFLGLLSDGFCSPKEGQSSAQGKGKLEEGTGLGEGDGAQDISNDIEDDEDLSEMAQGGKQEEKKDVEEEENAVDMADQELEGKFDDEAEEREDESAEQDQDDVGEDGPEEQIDEVDQTDPEALDEKMWDGKSDEEDARESKSDIKAGQKKDDLSAETGGDEEGKDEPLDEDNHSQTQEEGGEPVADDNLPSVDPNLKEEETLDLPDNMELDGDQRSVNHSDLDDDAMDEFEDNVEGEAQTDTEDEDVAADTRDQAPEALDDQENSLEENNDAQEVDEDMDDNDDTKEDMALRDTEGDAAEDDQVLGESEGLAGSGEQEDANEPQQDVNTNGVAGKSGAKNTEQGSEDTTEEDQIEATAAAGTGLGGAEDAQDEFESEAFKKLGNALERFERALKEIQRASDQDRNPAEEEAASQDVDFEHLPDDETEAETQALGAADKEQAKGLDQSVMDVEMTDPNQELEQDMPTLLEGDDAEDEQNEADDPLEQSSEPDKKHKASIGSRQRGKDSKNDTENATQEASSEDELKEIDDGVSEIQLQNQNGDGDAHARSLDEAQQLWSECESATHSLALSLTEQLRMILAPTQATKLRGNYKTGKRLNIKRVPAFIASGFKNDNLWMRRSVPSKRAYQIMLAVDDSKSMDESGNGSDSAQLAFETLALVSRSLTMLEAGQLCVVGFGADVFVAHPFEQPFSSASGPHIIQQFQFQQAKTDVQRLMSESLQLFRDARLRARSSMGHGEELWQLQLIISDGICENHAAIERLLRQAHQERVMVVFIIVDAHRGQSITELQEVSYRTNARTGEFEPEIKRYLASFPFSYYLIVGDVRDLPSVLATALRQWFAEVAET